MSDPSPSVPLRRLPPLNALRAFEAAARHLSITDAAKELAVTSGAVSQQIRLLEDHAGGPLFNRDGRNVVLTDLGGELYPILRAGFEHLQRAANLVYRPAGRRLLTIAAPPSFTAKWLAPRLARFTAAHPEIEVWISADAQPSDVAGGRVDVAIRYGRGAYPDLKVEHLLAADVLPICSPALLNGQDAPKAPEDLLRQTLIHTRPSDFEESYPDWPQWFAARGVANAETGAGVRVDQCAIAIETAAHGRGVALAPRALVAGDLARGRLVIPFADGLLKTELAYYLVTRKSNAPESVRKFVRWLTDEATHPDEWLDEL